MYIITYFIIQAKAYINMLQVKDDLCSEEKEMLTQKVLDARVESSVRFKFINPLVGMSVFLMDALEGAQFKCCLMQKVLDARVESSVRFKFINPLVGMLLLLMDALGVHNLSVVSCKTCWMHA